MIPKIKSLEVIPTDKLYDIHNDLRKYQHKWTSQQMVELADTSLIETFYTSAQYLNRIIPVIGATLVAKDNVQTGAIITGVSLYLNYLITTGKEKLFNSESKKAKLSEFKQELTNLYDRYEELLCLLKSLRPNDNLPELNQLLTELKSKLIEITKQEGINSNHNQHNLKRKLGYVFWSLLEKNPEDIKELILLKKGLKNLPTWQELSFSDKSWYELSRLFLSWRNKEDSQLWKEWQNVWEARRQEHQNIRDLTYLLQTVISHYQQEISWEEISTNIQSKISELSKLDNERVVEELEISDNQALIEMNVRD